MTLDFDNKKGGNDVVMNHSKKEATTKFYKDGNKVMMEISGTVGGEQFHNLSMLYESEIVQMKDFFNSVR